ncbi:energy transducer TonB [Azoarcus sp. KH32C]|uniref:energy transducer TonB n=1 Tax=Azoarcus sp. KH32C TaxID=748247 RepID=UPI001E4AF63E|nr:energy transducer TonB [Azoarcus sp. KH32C]
MKPAVAAASAPAPTTPVRFDAAYLNNPAPAYPPLSRRMREEGKVMLRVQVTAEGLPARVEVAESSGSGRLDQAAREAVQRWRFVPAKQDGHAVEAGVIVPIIFKLEGN